MKKICAFLRALAENNDRAWFEAHRADYREAEERFSGMVERVIGRIGEWDPDIAASRLQVKDCTYRIYRDIRFSADKRPYKTHMGGFICRGGKKSGYAGYYFHVEPAVGGSLMPGNPYPDRSLGHMAVAGSPCLDKASLASIRDEISISGDLYLKAIAHAEGYVLDGSSCLKRVPRGYSSCREEWTGLLRQKNFMLVRSLKEEDLLADDFADRVAADFRRCRPFVEIINRAIDYGKGNIL